MSRADRLELVTRLKENAAVAAAVEELKEQRDEYYTNLGRHMILSKDPVNQREIDFKAGYWSGALWAFTSFLSNAEPRLEKEIERSLKERT